MHRLTRGDGAPAAEHLDLEHALFSVPLDALPATESVLTVLGGRIVFDAGVLSP